MAQDVRVDWMVPVKQNTKRFNGINLDRFDRLLRSFGFIEFIEFVEFVPMKSASLVPIGNFTG